MEREIFCGDWHNGEKALCEDHFRKAQADYPQGWAYYPGDICPHGKYTGGCGADIMCGPCEMGD